MSNKTVDCVVLNLEAEALDSPPYPGELGRRVLENVSSEGWTQWLERLTIIINENGLNTADPQTLDLIEKPSAQGQRVACVIHAHYKSLIKDVAGFADCNQDTLVRSILIKSLNLIKDQLK